VRSRGRTHGGMVVVGQGDMGLRIAENNPHLEVHIFEDCWFAVDTAREQAARHGLCSRVHIRHTSAMPLVCRHLRR
jgi:methylase of polypeptide subunit release factors